MTIAEHVGWVLVHFIWQGAAIAGGLWLVLNLMTTTARATLRYALGCGALVSMLLAPIVTAVQFAGGADGATNLSPAPAAIESTATTPIAMGVTATARNVATPMSTARPTTVLATATPAVRARVAGVLPWLVLAWAVGVMLLSVRLAGGWWRTRRLRTQGIAPVPSACEQAAARLAARMRVARPVAFFVSVRVMVPVVFGHVKPIVLLPAAVLGGLSPSQLEAILAHELAHVRRHDYLVNLAQSVVETLLFYHPAVWWVSRQIRLAREDCCDDLAVTACGDRKGYVEALLGLEQLRQVSPLMALGATDGPLLARARRILTGAEREGTSPRLTASVIAMAVAALAMAGISTASDESGAAEPSSAQARAAGSRATAAGAEEAADASRLAAGTASLASSTDAAAAGAPVQTQAVIASPDLAGPFASRRAWADREARAQRAPRYWIGYAIRAGKGLPPLVYLDRHAHVLGDRMQFQGHVMSRRADGLLFPGQRLALADADASTIKLLFAFDASGRSPQLVQVHGSTLPLPVAVRDLPVFWLGSVEAAPSMALIDSFYGGASSADLKKDLVAALAVHDDSPAVVAWLDRRVRGNDSDEIRADAVEWIAWHPIPAALTALERAARQDRASRVRQEAAEALGDLALPEAADTLIALAKSLDDLDARREAVEALGARPELSARDALGAIARQDTHLDIQREAVETLGDYQDQRGAPLLIELARTHPRTEVRREAIETLGETLPGETAVPLLRRAALEDADPGVQQEAVETLGDLDRADARAIVMELARSHPRPEIRREAVETLAQEWQAAPNMASADKTSADKASTDKAASDKAGSDKAGANKAGTEKASADSAAAGTSAAGGAAGPDRAAILALLFDLAERDGDRSVQREAVESLGEIDDPQARDRLRALARTHPQPEVRREAVETLAEHTSSSADAVALLREVIQTEADTGVRVDAVERLAEVQHADAKKALIELARTHANDQIRAEAIESLAQAEPAAEIADLLKTIVAEDKSRRVRDEAIETLAELSAGAGIPALIEVARAHADPETRRRALDVLMESDHPRARQIFDRALQKPSGR